MTDITLAASSRADLGRHVHHLRREGQVPATLYGHNVTPRSLSAEAKALQRIWRQAGKTHLVDLAVDGAGSTKVLIRDIQFNPRTNAIVHADFFAVNLRERLTSEIPIHLTGTAPADEQKLGQLLQSLTSLKVECLPQDLPSSLNVDISGLAAVDDHVTVSAITLPKGVTLVHADPDEVVAKIAALRVAAEEDETAAEEGAEQAAEGEGDSASSGEPVEAGAE